MHFMIRTFIYTIIFVVFILSIVTKPKNSSMLNIDNHAVVNEEINIYDNKSINNTNTIENAHFEKQYYNNDILDWALIYSAFKMALKLLSIMLPLAYVFYIILVHKCKIWDGQLLKRHCYYIINFFFWCCRIPIYLNADNNNSNRAPDYVATYRAESYTIYNTNDASIEDV